jgi:hypothetical protein
MDHIHGTDVQDEEFRKESVHKMHVSCSAISAFVFTQLYDLSHL